MLKVEIRKSRVKSREKGAPKANTQDEARFNVSVVGLYYIHFCFTASSMVSFITDSNIYRLSAV